MFTRRFEMAERKPFDVFKENMRLALTPEECARHEAILADPNYQPREVQWRDDPDIMGIDWDWLEGAYESTDGATDK